MMDATRARAVIARSRYCVLSAASSDGRPWVAPVFFNCDASFRILWESARQSLHSQLIASNPRVAVVVADLEAEGPKEALYFECFACEVPPDRLEETLRAFKGGPHSKPECQARTVFDYLGTSTLRLYEAVPDVIYARVSKRSVDGYDVDDRVKLDLV
jgi:hypothetical protein